MNRERVAWAVSVVAIAVLAFQLPGSLAHRDDDYAWVRNLVDVHRQVANNYVEPIDEAKLRKAAIDGMLGQLDPYTVYVPPSEEQEFNRRLEGSFQGVGIQLDQDEKTLDVEVVSPIEGSPAFKAGVMAGDVITKVNNESIAGLRLEDVIAKVKGPVGSEVMLTVRRHGTGVELDLTMSRQEIVLPTIKGYKRAEDNSWDYFVSREPKVAYVRVTQFTSETYDKLRGVMEALLKDGMQGLVLDLRFNPGGRLDQAEDVVDLFIEEGTIVVTKGRNRPEKVTTAKAEDTLPDFPMVVLVNEHSASASEIVAGSLKDNNRALVVGTRSYGKGSVQELIPLDGSTGGELKLTVAYYYLPSGRLVHRKKDATDWGVEPQIIVPMDDDAERRLVQQQYENELFHKPNGNANGGGSGAAAQPSTKPTTRPADTRPTTQPAGPADPQLEAAVKTMIGHIVLRGERRARAAR